MKLQFWYLLWLTWSKEINPNDVICTPSSQKHSTWEKQTDKTFKKKDNLLLLQYFQKDVTWNISIYSLKFIAVSHFNYAYNWALSQKKI